MTKPTSATQSTSHTPTFRAMLKETLRIRMQENPLYSLRAFARDISISPGQLSLILNDKRGLSVKKAKRVLAAFELTPEEKHYYLCEIAKKRARSPATKKKAETKLKESHADLSRFQLTQDSFSVISNWQHFAILQALSLKRVSSCKTQSQQVNALMNYFKFEKAEILTVIDRLLRLNLIEIKDQCLSVCHDTVIANTLQSSAALRRFHRQVLQKSITALEEQTHEERYSNTVMLPVLESSFEAVREDVIQFQKKMIKKHGRVVQQDAEQVYGLTLQFFNLAKGKS